MKSTRTVRLASARLATVTLLAASLSACVTTPEQANKVQAEQFDSTATHTRNYGAAGSATCEAARRALLSQGYVIGQANADHVEGKKNFQPDTGIHVEVEFHVVCAPSDRKGKKSIAFVNALQDRYALKKSNNSASLGVGALGSVSLPFSSSDDAMVRVASETISNQQFYDRFFALVDRYLLEDNADDIPAEVKTAESKPAESKATEGKAPEGKPAEAKAASAP